MSGNSPPFRDIQISKLLNVIIYIYTIGDPPGSPNSFFWGNDGIYWVDDKGEKYRGYIFIQEPDIPRYGTPKFHLKKCKTIEEMIISGRLKARYIWTNADVNDLIDKTTKKIHKNQVLPYCKNCKQKFNDGITTTEDFFSKLDKSQGHQQLHGLL